MYLARHCHLAGHLIRIIQLVNEKRIPHEVLGYLQYGGWTSILSVGEVAQLVGLFLTGGPNPNFDAAADLMNRLSKEPECLAIVEPLVWVLVENKPDRNWEWQWGNLAARLAEKDPQRIVKIIVGFFASDGFVPISSDQTMRTLQTATSKDPRGAWKVVGGAILKGDEISMRMAISLTKWYGELIPTESLIAWAEQNAPHRWIVSRFVVVGQGPLRRGRAPY